MNKRWLRIFWNHFWDVIFPGQCPVCKGEAFKDGLHYTCLPCLDKVAWVRGTRCRICGIPMSGIDFRGLTCANCRDGGEWFFEEGRCLFLLDPLGKGIIHEMKYQGVKDVVGDLPAMIERVPGFHEYLEDSLLVPVPLHSKRLRERRFNQSLWIANEMSRVVDSCKVVDCLKRIRNTPTQTSLDKPERSRNVEGAFCLNKKVKFLDPNKRLIIVDDVFTTGATLNACAEVLVKADFSRISVATLGHG